MATRILRFYKSGSKIGFICLALILMLAGVVVAPRSAFAATVTVTTTGDTLDAGGGSCGAITTGILPGPDGVVSLREAVCAANNTAGNDTINFAGGGVYALTRTNPAGVPDDNSNYGDLDLLSNITITGNGASGTFINGNNSDRVFDIDPLQNSGAVVAITGVTITGGRVDPLLFNLGAGIATGASSDVTIMGSVITGNNSVNGTGGGIESFGRLTLNDVTVSSNTADAQGGGIRAVRPLTITLSTITNNTAETGGGLWLGSATGRDMSITDSSISNNHAVDRPGGLGPGSQDGGGLYIDTDSTVSVNRSTISDNDASRNGGGIYFRDQPGNTVGAVNLVNSTVSSNRANVDGGGLYVESGTLNVNYSTLPRNRADSDNNASGMGGGALRLAGTATFQNSILAGNILGSGAANDCSAGLTSGGYNLFGNNTICPQTTGDADLVTLGLGIAAVINTTLGNNGGPTLTHALVLSASNPAIDTANPSECLATDQRGTARPIGPRCDKGSFESTTPPTATPTNTPTDTPTNTPVPPTNTPTDTPTNTPVPPTNTPTDTPTNTPVPPTNTPTDTPTNTPVPPTNTPTDTPTNTPTNTPIPNSPPAATVTNGQCSSTNMASGVLNLTLFDPDGDPMTFVLASNSNPTMVPNSNIVLGGSGNSRTLAVTAAPRKSGTATLTFNLSDGTVTVPVVITVIVGTDKNETLNGTSGTDMIFGLGGRNTINGNGGNDLLCGGNSNDTLSGGDGNDIIDGENGNDTINGDNGNDILRGSAGNDTLTGGTGADSFSGGPGTDTATDFTPSQGDTQDGTIP